MWVDQSKCCKSCDGREDVGFRRGVGVWVDDEMTVERRLWYGSSVVSKEVNRGYNDRRG